MVPHVTPPQNLTEMHTTLVGRNLEMSDVEYRLKFRIGDAAVYKGEITGRVDAIRIEAESVRVRLVIDEIGTQLWALESLVDFAPDPA